MSLPEFAPPFTAPADLIESMRRQGFAVGTPAWVSELCGASSSYSRADPRASMPRLLALSGSWNDMPADPYLKDGGHYRRRRHASFVVEARGSARERNMDPGSCTLVPHRAHFQSREYNALHGGMQRWFEPMLRSVTEDACFTALLSGLAGLFSELKPARPWYVEAHQFRIDATDGIGRPTPEGAHRDGVDFVALFMVARENVRGGETRVFDALGPTGVRFTLSHPWSVLLLDDERVIHESTPIQPCHAASRAPVETRGRTREQNAERPSSAGECSAFAHRDTLVLTFRRGGFQEPG